MAPVKSWNTATVSVTRYSAAASRLAVTVRTSCCYTAIFSVPTILGRHDDCVQSVVGCGKEITEIGMSSGVPEATILTHWKSWNGKKFKVASKHMTERYILHGNVQERTHLHNVKTFVVSVRPRQERRHGTAHAPSKLTETLQIKFFSPHTHPLHLR